MNKYIKPTIETFDTNDLAESIGPIQAQSVSLEGFRGTFLHQEKEHRYYAVDKNNTKPDKIYNIKNMEGTKNV